MAAISDTLLVTSFTPKTVHTALPRMLWRSIKLQIFDCGVKFAKFYIRVFHAFLQAHLFSVIVDDASVTAFGGAFKITLSFLASFYGLLATYIAILFQSVPV